MKRKSQVVSETWTAKMHNDFIRESFLGAGSVFPNSLLVALKELATKQGVSSINDVVLTAKDFYDLAEGLYQKREQ